ncbi:MAG: hypothetical protein KAS32_29060 [Candidatus Peribacteraceae bacterium]|nr:hypothetical protein [Candidatus Peribacteraceae bacterium]
MGLRAGLVKSELKFVKAAWEDQIPSAKVAKKFRVKISVIQKCYAHFKKERSDAETEVSAGDGE